MNTTQSKPDLHGARGTIWAVFGHRLAIEGPDGRILVDLGPEGAKGLALKPGDTIAVTGERRPSEIKVASLTLPDGTQHAIPWKAPHHPGKPDHAPADPAIAVAALERAGYRLEGEVKRKPKHFELRAVKDGTAFAMHVALDGTIRRANPVAETPLPTP
ncbi:hypothetical protein [Methylobacterium sp. J-068]|uniref:hypothetical protein n=1 Tax=Methylobacterium sp. J-068 TaxID=2836649 RepID=UPI001FBB44C1|nr:hypothetical protein [Methylobacterium sp. J-068]MCJ2036047.1 hypothetical protein [Methylobacterium sp. J-068]